VTVLILYPRARLTWVVLLALGLLALAVAAGRAALRRDAIPERVHEHEVRHNAAPFAGALVPARSLRTCRVVHRNAGQRGAVGTTAVRA
jgi:hypothetical protein